MDSKESINADDARMIDTPANKSPVCSVPESANRPDNEYVPDDFPFSGAASSQREINVVPEPGHQRDVPSAPELRDAAGEIREIEVLHQADSEQAGTADGDV